MRKYLRIDELAELLQVPRSWTYDRTRRSGFDRIPHLKMGKYLRFNPESDAFLAWLEAHEIGSTGNDAVPEKPALGAAELSSDQLSRRLREGRN